MELIFVTHNANKASEINDILGPDRSVLSLSDIGWNEEIPETGDTLEENALIKARAVYKRHSKPCFADDTGLEVKALGGAPGVYSARYAGEDANAENNLAKLLKELEGQQERAARFRTVIAYIDNKGAEHLFEGMVEGFITTEKKGAKGFGYDPVFRPQGHEDTFAEMTKEQKNEISHRRRAMDAFLSGLDVR